MGLRSKKDVVKSLKTFHNNFNNNYIYISIQKKQIPWVIFVAQQNFVHKILFAYKSHKVITVFLYRFRYTFGEFQRKNFCLSYKQIANFSLHCSWTQDKYRAISVTFIIKLQRMLLKLGLYRQIIHYTKKRRKIWTLLIRLRLTT